MAEGCSDSLEDLRIAQRLDRLGDDHPEGEEVVALKHFQILLNTITEWSPMELGDVDQFVADDIDRADEVRRCRAPREYSGEA